MSTIALQATSIYRRYHTRTDCIEVLRGINLTAAAGQWICLTGPSGCGKTTLLRILGLLDRMDDGEIELFGESIRRASSFHKARIRRLKLGFVFQSYELFPELNAIENVTLPARIAGTFGKSAYNYARKLMEEMGIGDRLHHCPTELSGGEQQRVAIARAVINEPEIILADEPTGNLDERNSNDIMEIIRRLRDRSNCTIIMVTHNESLTRFADHTHKMKDGLLI